MTVKARFWVSNKTEHQTQQNIPSQPAYRSTTIEMKPVFGEGNEDWSEATPQGAIEMTITNRDAAEQFELGEIYELTFEKIQPEAPADS